MRSVVVALILLVQPLVASATLELVVLGSGGPRAFGRAGTSYLVLVDGEARVLVDAGPGAFVQLGKLGIDTNRLEVILLTHLHIDHSADVPAIFLARALSADGPIRFRVFGPAGSGAFPGVTQWLHVLFEAGGAFPYQKTFGADEEIEGHDLPTALESPVQELVSADGVTITAVATHHGDCPSIAYRVEHGGKSITFSGDMDASALPNLERLARDTDLLVAHAAVLDPPLSPEQLYALHTPPRALGEAARAARVKALLLAHIAPAIEARQAAVLRSVSASYKGAVRFARDGLRVPIRRTEPAPSR